MDLVGTAVWTEYQRLMDEAHDTFNQATLVWHRYSYGLDYSGRDRANDTFEQINLKVLLDFNYYHKWPINDTTPSGELDRMNVFCYINRNYLNSIGKLTLQGNLAYGDKFRDRFIYQGVVYKSFGETEVSQAPNNPLHVAIILQRQETMTGDTPDTRNKGIRT